jgi:ABC-2 type transport system permease protein
VSPTVADAGPVPRRVDRSHTGADAAVARRAFRQVRTSALVCAIAFGGTAAASALSYVSSFATLASRQQLAAATGGDTGLAVLLGPVSAIDTVGGYTVYKGFVFLTTIGAIWAVLAATRLLRGEEDAGRWQLVLTGSTRASRVTAASIGALAVAVGVILLGTSALTLLAGRNPDVGFGAGGSLFYGLSVALPAAVFGSVGAVTSQLGRTRRAASGLGITVLAFASVVRMIADSGSSTHWLHWATPFGWTELMHPFTGSDAVPILPAVATALGLAATAIVLSARRDVGDGVFASRDVVHPRPFGLGSALGIAARLELPVLGAWSAGLAASGFAFGVVSKMTTAKAPDSLNHTLDKFGVHGSFVTRYFGVVFLLVAAVVALLPAGQIASASEEETSGRLVHVLTRPVKRTTWFAGRLVLAAAGVGAAGVLAGTGAWAGAATQGVDVGFAEMLRAGLNVVPTGLVALGIGALALAIAPRSAATTVYSVVGWSLIVDVLASTVSGLGGLDHVSLLHYMALAPAQRISATTVVVTLGVALALGIGATEVFRRRDVLTR